MWNGPMGDPPLAAVPEVPVCYPRVSPIWNRGKVLVIEMRKWSYLRLFGVHPGNSLVPRNKR